METQIFQSATTSSRAEQRGKTRSSKRGFTLIELLVVIAIIAILAAILFPVFARARENARRSSCQSNLKQIGLGIMQYTQDYDEFYPLGSYATTGGNFSWRHSIQPYIKSTQLFKCPSNTQTATDDNINNVRQSVNYSGNTRIFGDGGGFGLQSQGGINAVSQKIIVGESNYNFNQPNIMSSNWDAGTAVVDRMFAGHLGTMNNLFADGHVKALKPTATMTPLNMWGAFQENSNTGDCTSIWDSWGAGEVKGINCDEIAPTVLSRLGELQKKYE